MAYCCKVCTPTLWIVLCPQKIVIALLVATEDAAIATGMASTVRVCSAELIGRECLLVPLHRVEVGKLFICDVLPVSKDSLG